MKNKNQFLKILYLGDKLSDLKWIKDFLKNSIRDFEIKSAKTEKEFFKFILRFKPDIILSEFEFEKYSAARALDLLKEENYEIPVIIISDEINNELTNELLKKGFEDCILKSNLTLLPAVIYKAIEKEAIRKEKNKIELELKSEQERLGIIFENTPEAIINIGFKGEILEINPKGLGILQVDTQAKLKNKNIFSFIHPDDIKKFKKFHNSVGIGNKKNETFKMIGAKKKEYWIESKAVPVVDEENHIISVLTINRDITDLVNTKDQFENSEEKFRKLAMYAPVGIFLTDEKGDSIFVNKRWCELAGIEEKQAKGNGWIKALHPDDREKVFKEWYNCASEGREFKMDYRFLKPSGEIIWLSSSAVALQNSSGEISGYIGTITDISGHVNNKQAIFETEKLLDVTQQNANIGYWNLDLVGRNRVWSKQMFRIYERDEKTGAPTFNEFINYIHPDDREYLLNFHQNLLRTGENKRIEFRIILNDGKTKHIVGSAQAIINKKNGEPENVLGTAMDVSERKKNEEDFQESEKKFQELFDFSPDGIYVEDDNGYILNVNKAACEFLGYNKEEIIGKHIRDFTPDAIKNNILYGTKILLKNKYETFESYCWDRNWNPRPVEIRTRRIVYNGKPALLLNLRDISNRRKAEKANRDLKIKFNTLAEEAPVAIYQIDKEGNFILVNKKFLQLFDISKEEVTGDFWSSRIHPDDLQTFLKIRKETLAENKAIEVQYRLFIKGHVKFVIGKSNPLLNDEGEFIGRIGTILQFADSDQYDKKLISA